MTPMSERKTCTICNWTNSETNFVIQKTDGLLITICHGCVQRMYQENERLQSELAEQRKEIEELRKQGKWISVKERLPESDTIVLVAVNDSIRIGELRWEYPTFEESFKPYRYWDNPFDDGQDWQYEDITHWQPLPQPPKQ